MQRLRDFIPSPKQKRTIKLILAGLLLSLILWKLTHVSLKAYFSFSIGILAPIIFEGYLLYSQLHKAAKKQSVELNRDFGKHISSYNHFLTLFFS